MGSDEKLENFISRFNKVYKDANHPAENKQAIKKVYRQLKNYTENYIGN